MRITDTTNHLNFGMQLKMDQTKLSYLEKFSLEKTNKIIGSIKGPIIDCKFIRAKNKHPNTKTILLGILDKDVIVHKCESIYISEQDFKKLSTKILDFLTKL